MPVDAWSHSMQIFSIFQTSEVPNENSFQNPVCQPVPLPFTKIFPSLHHEPWTRFQGKRREMLVITHHNLATSNEQQSHKQFEPSRWLWSTALTRGQFWRLQPTFSVSSWAAHAKHWLLVFVTGFWKQCDLATHQKPHCPLKSFVGPTLFVGSTSTQKLKQQWKTCLRFWNIVFLLLELISGQWQHGDLCEPHSKDLSIRKDKCHFGCCKCAPVNGRLCPTIQNEIAKHRETDMAKQSTIGVIHSSAAKSPKAKQSNFPSVVQWGKKHQTTVHLKKLAQWGIQSHACQHLMKLFVQHACFEMQKFFLLCLNFQFSWFCFCQNFDLFLKFCNNRCVFLCEQCDGSIIWHGEMQILWPLASHDFCREHWCCWKPNSQQQIRVLSMKNSDCDSSIERKHKNTCNAMIVCCPSLAGLNVSSPWCVKQCQCVTLPTWVSAFASFCSHIEWMKQCQEKLQSSWNLTHHILQQLHGMCRPIFPFFWAVCVLSGSFFFHFSFSVRQWKLVFLPHFQGLWNKWSIESGRWVSQQACHCWGMAFVCDVWLSQTLEGHNWSGTARGIIGKDCFSKQRTCKWGITENNSVPLGSQMFPVPPHCSSWNTLFGVSHQNTHGTHFGRSAAPWWHNAHPTTNNNTHNTTDTAKKEKQRSATATTAWTEEDFRFVVDILVCLRACGLNWFY